MFINTTTNHSVAITTTTTTTLSVLECVVCVCYVSSVRRLFFEIFIEIILMFMFDLFQL